MHRRTQTQSGPTTSPRGRSWLWAGITSAAVLALLCATAAEVVSLQRRATENLRAQVALANVAHQVDGVRYWPIGFVNGASYYPAVSATEDGLRHRAEIDAAELTRLSPLGRPIQGLVGRLSALAGEELALVGSGHSAEARSMDKTQLEPLYEKLVAAESKADPILEAAARASDTKAIKEVVGIVVGGGVLLVAGLAAFESSRRRRLRAVATDEALRASEERFRALVQNSSDVITVVASDGTVLFQAPSVSSVLGYEPSTLEGQDMASIVHPDDGFRFGALCMAGSHDGEDLRLRHADGTWRTCELRGTNLAEHPEVRGVVLNIRDVSERKALEEELRHQAFHDALTGLANRALFGDRIEHALARQSRTGEPLAVLLIDLDDFKAINDSLGHATGDRLLAEVATRIRGAVRASDTVARLGGDEFAVLLEDPSSIDAPEHAADRVLSAFSRPVRLDGRALVISASVGVAISTDGTATADELVRNADVAMYVAKAQGKGRWARFDPGMHLAIQERLELKTDLLQALADGNQMELHYQPVVKLATGKVVGVEALLRWRHPKRGLVAPLEFLPLAEDCGLIVPLGRWVLREAFLQLARWQARDTSLRELSMSVNVSGRQLEDRGLVEDVRTALEESGLDPSAVVLEITETVLIREAEITIETLCALKALGVRLAIDDFGTGYSSLGYLQHFPIDVIKVDRMFISGIGTEPRQAALAEAVVKIGATLEMQTVAEGVELVEQADRLRHLGCEFGQGFLFSKPVPPSAFEVLLGSDAPAAVG